MPVSVAVGRDNYTKKKNQNNLLKPFSKSSTTLVLCWLFLGPPEDSRKAVFLASRAGALSVFSSGAAVLVHQVPPVGDLGHAAACSRQDVLLRGEVERVQGVAGDQAGGLRMDLS